ncbi:MAG: hypothetical protein KAR13_00160, partial [Desulfobulbaceae bacterium]|nr:hypothetical protein [Desulfobulbaceae bacterium]
MTTFFFTLHLTKRLFEFFQALLTQMNVYRLNTLCPIKGSLSRRKEINSMPEKNYKFKYDEYGNT